MANATISNTRAWSNGHGPRMIEWHYTHPESPDTPTRARASSPTGGSQDWTLALFTPEGEPWTSTAIDPEVIRRIRDSSDGLGSAYDAMGAPIIRTWLTRFYVAHPDAPHTGLEFQ